MMLVYAVCALVSLGGMYFSQKAIKANVEKHLPPDGIDTAFLWCSSIIFGLSLTLFIGF